MKEGMAQDIFFYKKGNCHTTVMDYALITKCTVYKSIIWLSLGMGFIKL